jgi:hypothetical protein
MIDKIRELLLKIALPKKQFYIQCGGFHSVFSPILHKQFDKEAIDGTSNTDNNGVQPVH